MLGIVAPPHGETFRKALTSASRARPAAVVCAACAAASSLAALAALSAKPCDGPSTKFVSWMF